MQKKYWCRKCHAEWTDQIPTSKTECPNCNAKPQICPSCKKPYFEFPALSRKDNETHICSDCGMAEALQYMYL